MYPIGHQNTALAGSRVHKQLALVFQLVRHCVLYLARVKASPAQSLKLDPPREQSGRRPCAL